MTLSTDVPKHIAIVMDGNGRWAKKRFLPRLAGHKQGVNSLKRCVKTCAGRGVKILTVFAFSSENWKRPAEEVSGLMDLLVKALSNEVAQLKQDGVKLCFVGDRTGLSDKVVMGLAAAESDTEQNCRLTLNICFNFGGRWDIVQAAERLRVAGTPITEMSLSAVLSLAHLPDPDLFIRTGGEQRLSNFLLWQTAYSELYFSDVLWPEFDEEALDLAIQSYSQRERRFGKTSDQLAPNVAQSVAG